MWIVQTEHNGIINLGTKEKEREYIIKVKQVTGITITSATMENGNNGHTEMKWDKAIGMHDKEYEIEWPCNRNRTKIK